MAVQAERAFLKELVLEEVSALKPAWSVSIGWSAPIARDFWEKLYAAWIERIDHAEAWNVLADQSDDSRWGPLADDKCDLINELANSAVESVHWNGDLVGVFNAVEAWQCDCDIPYPFNVTDGSSLIDLMRLILAEVCYQYLWSLHDLAVKCITTGGQTTRKLQ